MPNTSSAKKALRRDDRRKVLNKKRKKKLKDTIKKFEKAADSGNIKEAKEMLPTVQKTIDKLAKISMIHKNKAARIKSRLSKKIKEN